MVLEQQSLAELESQLHSFRVNRDVNEAASRLDSPTMRQRVIPALTAAIAASTLTACEKHDVVHEAETEAGYVAVGPKAGEYLKYQVQISRMLNPGKFSNKFATQNPSKVDFEDIEYLRGLTVEQRRLKKGAKPIDNESYFGVFIVAHNENDHAIRSEHIDNFKIEDTLGNHYSPVKPVKAGVTANPFLYTAGRVPAKDGVTSGVYPPANSPAGNSTTRGSLLLFKIPASRLENRPLTLHIEGRRGGEAEIKLDV